MEQPPLVNQKLTKQTCKTEQRIFVMGLESTLKVGHEFEIELIIGHGLCSSGSGPCYRLADSTSKLVALGCLGNGHDTADARGSTVRLASIFRYAPPACSAVVGSVPNAGATRLLAGHTGLLHTNAVSPSLTM